MKAVCIYRHLSLYSIRRSFWTGAQAYACRPLGIRPQCCGLDRGSSGRRRELHGDVSHRVAMGITHLDGDGDGHLRRLHGYRNI